MASVAVKTTPIGVKKTVAVDFDGVIHLYSKNYHDGTIYDPPVPGSLAGLSYIERLGFQIVIFTARPNRREIRHWLKKNGFPPYKVTNRKPPAILYIDDKGMRFESWEKVTSHFTRNYRQ